MAQSFLNIVLTVYSLVMSWPICAYATQGEVGIEFQGCDNSLAPANPEYARESLRLWRFEWSRFLERLLEVHAPRPVTIYDDEGKVQKISLLSYQHLKNKVTYLLDSESYEMPGDKLLERLTRESVLSYFFPDHALWSLNSVKEDADELTWDVFRYLHSAEGDLFIVRARQPLDRSDLPTHLKGTQKIISERDLRNQILNFRILRDLGFKYDTVTGNMTLPREGALNKKLDQYRGSWPIDVRFEEVYFSGPAPFMVYARHRAKGVRIIGVGDTKLHDYEDHLLEALALPASVNVIYQSRLKMFLDLYDHPAFEDNFKFRDFLYNSIKDFIDAEDTSFGRDFLWDLKQQNLASIEESEFVKFMFMVSRRSVADDLSHILNRTYLESPAGNGFAKGQWHVELSKEERAVVQEFLKSADTKRLALDEILAIVKSPVYYRQFVGARQGT